MRIGMLSAAHVHADAYAANLRAIADLELVGVADHDRLRARRWGNRHGVPVYDDVDELLRQGLDGVLVCSENAHHRELVERAARAGAAVLCEKPLATSHEDARAIVEACATADVTLMTAFPMRFSPPMRAVSDLVQRGALGRIRAASGTNRGELPMRHRHWFVDRALSGGGAFMDHVVHVTDVLRWYLREEPVEVYAVANRILHGETVDVETGGLVSLLFDGGTVATIDSSWSRPDRYPSWGGLTLELVGDEGVISVDPFRQRLDVFSDAGEPVRWMPWGSDANQAMVEEFVGAIAAGRAPTVTGRDGLAATAVALACYESDRSGRPVAVPSLEVGA